MTLRQLYYTSCAKGTTGTAGFQIKAMSPGLAPDEQDALNKILGYRIPPSLDVDAIASHPVALRYQYLSRDKCLLLCSQSNGTDEGGRPGNFFAHCIATSPADFDVFAPIMYWRNPFWMTSDPSASVVIAEQAEFEPEPSLEFESIWPFLDAGNRRQWFYRLLCAVLHYDDDSRPVVILDSVDNIALWIAAATFALPAAYRRFVSFATYHHDPYQVPFWITGTTSDTRFRFTPDEYISYFVLNAVQDRISDVKDSVYAQFVSRFMSPEAYETKLISFFEYCSDHLRASPRHMAQQFDTVTDLYLTVREKSLPITHPSAQASLSSLLAYAEMRETLPEEDLVDLTNTADLYREALRSLPTSELMADYVRTLRLLKRHDPNFARRCRDELEFAVHVMLLENEDLVGQIFSVIQELWSLDTLRQLVNTPEFVNALSGGLPKGRWQPYHLTWKFLGPWFRANAANQSQLRSLIQATFSILDRLATQGSIIPPPAADTLLTDLEGAMRENGETGLLIDGAIAWRILHPGPSFDWLYYQLVGKVSLDKRDSYRGYFTSIAPSISQHDLIVVEVNRDFSATPVDRMLPLIEAWVKHTDGQPALQSDIVYRAVELVWSTADRVRLAALSEQLLASQVVSPYIVEPLINKLVQASFADFRMKQLDSRSFPLVQKFVEHPSLSSDQRAMMKGSLAMTTGRFPKQTVLDTRDWLSRLNRGRYKEEAKKLINRFFAQDITLEGHIEMLQATYVAHYQAEFWELYWARFKELFLDRDAAQKTASILSFWFDESLPVFQEQPYLGPSFFLQLPGFLETVKQEKESRQVVQWITSKSADLPWYAVMRPYFAEIQKRGLLSFRS